MSKSVTTANKPETVHPLRAARVNQNMTLADVGRILGVERAAVSKWELGQAMPRPAQAVALIQLFPTLTLDDLYQHARAA